MGFEDELNKIIDNTLLEMQGQIDPRQIEKEADKLEADAKKGKPAQIAVHDQKQRRVLEKDLEQAQAQGEQVRAKRVAAAAASLADKASEKAGLKTESLEEAVINAVDEYFQDKYE